MIKRLTFYLHKIYRLSINRSDRVVEVIYVFRKRWIFISEEDLENFVYRSDRVTDFVEIESIDLHKINLYLRNRKFVCFPDLADSAEAVFEK
jgi:hypothetical protein